MSEIRRIPRRGAGTPMIVRVEVRPGRHARAAVRRLARADWPVWRIAKHLALRPGFVADLVDPWKRLREARP